MLNLLHIFEIFYHGNQRALTVYKMADVLTTKGRHKFVESVVQITVDNETNIWGHAANSITLELLKKSHFEMVCQHCFKGLDICSTDIFN